MVTQMLIITTSHAESVKKLCVWNMGISYTCMKSNGQQLGVSQIINID